MIILPGYPKVQTNPLRLLVSFYVLNPSDSSVLPVAVLYDAVSSNQKLIEAAVGTSLSVDNPTKTTASVPSTLVPTEAPDDSWKWILTGVLVGVFVIILIIVIVVIV